MKRNRIHKNSHAALRSRVSDGGVLKRGRDGSILSQADMPLTEFDRIVLKQAAQEITTRNGGVTSKTNMKSGLVMAITKSALSNNSNSQRLMFKLIEEAEAKKQVEDARNANYWASYKQLNAKEIILAREKGLQEPNCIPHPDDIHIYADNTVEFDGPVTQWEADHMDHTAKVRDVLLMQDEYEQRKGVLEPHPDQPQTQPGSLLLAVMLNDLLPARLKLGDTQLLLKQMELKRHTKRELQKLLYRDWKACGVQLKRGATLPTFEVIKKRLETLANLIGEINRGTLEVSGKPIEQIAREITPYIR